MVKTDIESYLGWNNQDYSRNPGLTTRITLELGNFQLVGILMYPTAIQQRHPTQGAKLQMNKTCFETWGTFSWVCSRRLEKLAKNYLGVLKRNKKWCKNIHFGVILRALWEHSWSNSGACLEHFGRILRAFWFVFEKQKSRWVGDKAILRNADRSNYIITPVNERQIIRFGRR